MVYTLILYKSYFIKPKLFQLKKKKKKKNIKANALEPILLLGFYWGSKYGISQPVGREWG